MYGFWVKNKSKIQINQLYYIMIEHFIDAIEVHA